MARKTAVALLRSPAFLTLLIAVSVALWLSPRIALLVVMFVLLSLILQLDWIVAVMEQLEPRVRWRCKLAAKHKLVGLTIDDVPLLNHPSHLEEVLDVLKDNGMHATLFVMSGFTESEEEVVRDQGLALLKRAVAEGHELGNHHMYDEPGFALTDLDLETKFARGSPWTKRRT
uniref:NodB homology domain-containing protein n=1 Tax=Haptolina brevifila TaxID=156173 RepID=A0A7S2HR71_9EUKA|mmetsp:Transcript_57066/g.113362  ORF Transcript_57066/g.113362 Transcript_57066/m.113362 type:complete len:173 (+) Transcript_57066:40-558(+)